MTTPETLWRQGEAEAQVAYGPDCRPFDRALGGMAAVLRANGRLAPRAEDIAQYGEIKAGVLTVADRWHCPLASFTDGMPWEQILGMFDWALGLGVQDDVRTYRPDPARVLYRRTVWDVDDSEVASFFRREVKQKFPQCRKGSRQWKQLEADYLPKARILLEAQREAERRTERQHARWDYDRTILPEVEKAEKAAERLDLLAGDCEALGLQTEMIGTARARAKGLRELAVRYRALRPAAEVEQAA